MPGLDRAGKKATLLSVPAVLILLMVGLSAISDVSVRAASLSVDSLLDTPDAAHGNGVCDDGSGNCTLRAAIEEANALPGPDIINFSLSGSGPFTIQPTSPLPIVTDQAIIDGYSQVGSTGNAAPPALGTDAVLMIELDGRGAGTPDVPGLHITGGNTTVTGLAINRFSGDGIRIEGAGGNTISGNFIGTDVTGSRDKTEADPKTTGFSVTAEPGTVPNFLPGREFGGTEGPYRSETNNPVGPWFGEPVLFAGTSVGGAPDNALQRIGDIVFTDPTYSAWIYYDHVNDRPDGLVVVSDDELLMVNENSAAPGVYRARRGDMFSDDDEFSTIGAPMENPDNIARAADGTVFVTDNFAQSVLRIPAGGGAPEVFLSSDITGMPEFVPGGVAIAPPGFDGPNVDPGDLLLTAQEFQDGLRELWVVDSVTGDFQVLSARDQFLTDHHVSNVVFGGDGTLYVSETGPTPGRISTVSPDGTVTPLVENIDGLVWGLAVNPVTDEVFFRKIVSSVEELHRVPGSGGTPSLFSADIGQFQSLVFSADGNSLFIGAQQPRSQVIEIVNQCLPSGAGCDPIGRETLGAAELIYRYRLEFDQPTDLNSISVFGAAFNPFNAADGDSVLRILDENMNVLGTTSTFGGNNHIRHHAVSLEGINGTVFFIEEFDSSGQWRYRESLVINGPVPIGNTGRGVYITGGTDNQVGGVSPDQKNIISGNRNDGIGIEGIATGDNSVLGNFVGSDFSGTADLGNGNEGIHIRSSAGNVVGATAGTNPAGPCSGACNLVSGNAGDGIVFRFVESTDNVAEGNFVGTDLTGMVPLGNSEAGFRITQEASNNRVGGATPEARNIVSNNLLQGITVGAGANGIAIIGNYIGTDVTGTAEMGNAREGIHVGDSQANKIGGPNPGDGNVVSANHGDGISIRNGSSLNVVQGNLIGTDFTGTTAFTGDIPITSGFAVTAEPGTSPTWVAGTDHEGFVSDSADPTAPWFGGSVHFRGNAEGGGLETVDGVPLVYRYRLEFTEVTQLISVAVTGAAFSDGDSQIRVLDENMNPLGSTRTHGGNSHQTFFVELDGVSGQVFFIEETDWSDGWQYRESIVINGPVPLGNRGWGGIVIADGAQDNLVGGPTPRHRNIISGNRDNGIVIADSGTMHNVVENNFIGTDFTATSSLGNEGWAGIIIVGGASENRVGGSVAGGNVISGNRGNGVAIADPGTTGNQFHGNFIGTDPTGSFAIPNRFNGFEIWDGPQFNTIGGTTPGERNIISGNGDVGVRLIRGGTTDNEVIGNFIGTDVSGTLPLGNGAGVVIVEGSNRNRIGGPNPGEGNLVSANQWVGIEIAHEGSNENVISGNLIGTDHTGTTGFTPGNTITSGFTVTAEPGTAPTWDAGTDHDGFVSDSADPTAPWFGGSVHFRGNGEGGGLETVDGVPLVYRYRLEFDQVTELKSIAVTGAAFSDDGSQIRVLDENMTVLGTSDTWGGNSRQIFFVGLAGVVGRTFFVDETDWSGSWQYRESIVINGPVPLGNRGWGGVQISEGAQHNQVGGPTPGHRNIISGNRDNGMVLVSPGTSHNIITGNFIGTDISGTASIQNRNHGVLIVDGASFNRIGGSNPGEGNVLSGNRWEGIEIRDANTTGTEIKGNFIGTDVTGMFAVPNHDQGINIVDSPNNLIGGTEGVTIGGSCTGACNLLSGNEGEGLSIRFNGATGNIAVGNYIGTDVTGLAALGNLHAGVMLRAGTNVNVLGGTTPAERNVISGGRTNGVLIWDDSYSNTVQGNFIGVDATGLSPLGNQISGVVIATGASDNLIGGSQPGTGNIIAFNGQGVLVGDAALNSNTISANSIHSNLELGIDLAGNGVTPNDLGDADAGPNNLQNFPVIRSVATVGGITTVEGSLNSRPTTEYRIEFFSNSSADPSGHGEGETFLGSAIVITDAFGNADFSMDLPAVQSGLFITTTATSAHGDTSEFSAAWQEELAASCIYDADSSGFIELSEAVDAVTDYLLGRPGPAGEITRADAVEVVTAYLLQTRLECNAVPGPSADWIVYQTSTNGDLNIARILPDGAGAIQVVTGATQDLFPTWSPDKSEIAFTRQTTPEGEDRNGDIHIVGFYGSNLRSVTGGGDYHFPDWSLDGSSIIFDGFGSGIQEVSPSGGNVDVIVNDGFADRPDWSPDGGKIAFHVPPFASGALSAWAGLIVIANADGTDPQPLTEGLSPDWSPDGSKILFNSDVDGDWDVYVIGTDGTDLTNLTSGRPGDDVWPDWSPDGSEIVFSFTADGIQSRELGVMSAAGGAVTNITNTPDVDELRPQW